MEFEEADIAAQVISDPVSCGENLAQNLRCITAIAPSYCDGCADYHVVNALKRLTGHTVWARGGRAALVAALRPILTELAARPAYRPDLLVAACADTAILSTLAHAVWLQGKTLFERTRFTVLDRCRTPLALCEEYGVRNGLDLKTEVIDLTSTSTTFSADFIILHNLFGFLPEERHRDVAGRLWSWLKVGGCMIVWHPLPITGERDKNLVKLKSEIITVREMINDGRIVIDEPADDFVRRLERRFDNAPPFGACLVDIEALTGLVESVGFNVRSADELSNIQGARKKPYVMMVAEKT